MAGRWAGGSGIGEKDSRVVKVGMCGPAGWYASWGAVVFGGVKGDGR